MALSDETKAEITQLKEQIQVWQTKKQLEVYVQVAILKSIQTPMEKIAAPAVSQIIQNATEIIKKAEAENEEK